MNIENSITIQLPLVPVFHRVQYRTSHVTVCKTAITFNIGTCESFFFRSNRISNRIGRIPRKP